MIATVAELAAQAKTSQDVIRANLSHWKKQGFARKANRRALWFVNNKRWKRYLEQKRPSWKERMLCMLPSVYLKNATARYHARVQSIKMANCRSRAESFARRNPFVVLE